MVLQTYSSTGFFFAVHKILMFFIQIKKNLLFIASGFCVIHKSPPLL